MYFKVLQAIYDKIDTDDEGDITIKKVVEHIRAIEVERDEHDVNEISMAICNKEFKYWSGDSKEESFETDFPDLQKYQNNHRKQQLPSLDQKEQLYS